MLTEKAKTLATKMLSKGGSNKDGYRLRVRQRTEVETDKKKKEKIVSESLTNATIVCCEEEHFENI